MSAAASPPWWNHECQAKPFAIGHPGNRFQQRGRPVEEHSPSRLELSAATRRDHLPTRNRTVLARLRDGVRPLLE